MDKLKPCPFCGSNPTFGKPSETKTSLRCSNTQCYLWWNPPTSWHNGDTEEHARLRLTTWWNKRADTKEIDFDYEAEDGR